MSLINIALQNFINPKTSMEEDYDSDSDDDDDEGDVSISARG